MSDFSEAGDQPLQQTMTFDDTLPPAFEEA
jgi:hypothetical protein